MSELTYHEEKITARIFIFRQHKVLLDADLAHLFGVETKRLKEAVRRNRERFPEDFMFELTVEEMSHLRSQIASSSWGGTRYAPFAFTEHGVVMLASLLNSPIAIEASIEIVRAFVKMRQLINDQEQMHQRIDNLEARFEAHAESVLEAIEALTEQRNQPRPTIGFKK
jgi:hypothetical protein